MTDDTDLHIVELEEAKADLERRIREFQAEIRTINNLIYRRKSKTFAKDRDENVTGKNIDRLFFETLILDTLKTAKRGLRTGEIHTQITKSGYGLNYNTLRSYVTKMRDKGLIKKASPSSYLWITPEK